MPQSQLLTLPMKYFFYDSNGINMGSPALVNTQNLVLVFYHSQKDDVCARDLIDPDKKESVIHRTLIPLPITDILKQNAYKKQLWNDNFTQKSNLHNTCTTVLQLDVCKEINCIYWLIRVEKSHILPASCFFSYIESIIHYYSHSCAEYLQDDFPQSTSLSVYEFCKAISVICELGILIAVYPMELLLVQCLKYYFEGLEKMESRTLVFISSLSVSNSLFHVWGYLQSKHHALPKLLRYKQTLENTKKTDCMFYNILIRFLSTVEGCTYYESNDFISEEDSKRSYEIDFVKAIVSYLTFSEKNLFILLQNVFPRRRIRVHVNSGFALISENTKNIEMSIVSFYEWLQVLLWCNKSVEFEIHSLKDFYNYDYEGEFDKNEKIVTLETFVKNRKIKKS